MMMLVMNDEGYRHVQDPNLPKPGKTFHTDAMNHEGTKKSV